MPTLRARIANECWFLFRFHAKPRVVTRLQSSTFQLSSLFSSKLWPTNPARWRLFRQWTRPNRSGPSHCRIIRRWSFVLSCLDHDGGSSNIEYCWDYWIFTRNNLWNYSSSLTLSKPIVHFEPFFFPKDPTKCLQILLLSGHWSGFQDYSEMRKTWQG